jgi:ketosteroid isomerase-like protein
MASSSIRLRLFALTATLFSLHCASAPPAPDPQSVRAAILRADEDFARLAQQKGIAEAFATYAAEDATILPAGANPIEGREAIRSYFAAATGLTLTWKPVLSQAAASGDLGYTLGTYESRSTGEDGKPVTRYGKYCTIWKKQADGTWKYIVDLGNPSPAPN